MKHLFNIKLILLCIVGLLLFSIGTIKYYGNPYTRYRISVLTTISETYVDYAKEALREADCASCVGDEANTEYYNNLSIDYFHIADSTLKEAEAKRQTLK